MSRPIAVLRPEPGNARTAAAIERLGRTAIGLPLFEVAPIVWEPPDPRAFDGLLLTSANAVRHGGAGLDALRTLPVWAVGATTAAAAKAAGFAVAELGTQGAASLLASATTQRLLHLAGREHHSTKAAATIPVYAADAVAIAPGTIATLRGSVVLLHSARAARTFAALRPDRSAIRIAALSAAVAEAAGDGWAIREATDLPRDDALIRLGIRLSD